MRRRWRTAQRAPAERLSPHPPIPDPTLDLEAPPPAGIDLVYEEAHAFLTYELQRLQSIDNKVGIVLGLQGAALAALALVEVPFVVRIAGAALVLAGMACAGVAFSISGPTYAPNVDVMVLVAGESEARIKHSSPFPRCAPQSETHSPRLPASSAGSPGPSASASSPSDSPLPSGPSALLATPEGGRTMEAMATQRQQRSDRTARRAHRRTDDDAREAIPPYRGPKLTGWRVVHRFGRLPKIV